MKSKNRQPEPTTSALPVFLMWRKLPDDPRRPWKRQWFGHELAPKNPFTVRGIGIREPQFRRNVHRPHGTGDWLVMLFHKPPRLERMNYLASHPALTLVIWPPGAEQFYGWSQRANAEPHSWMHIEGTFVSQQIESLKLPVNTPFSLPNENVMVNALENLYEEMLQGLHADTVILQNLFENWARGIHRQIQSRDPSKVVPLGLLRVREHLDTDFRRIPPLDELAKLAAMSRSHLCHRFREFFGSTISGYVIRKRMATAQRLLFEIHLRMGEIAEAVGYPDIFQFSKQFKKTFGISPKEFRNRQIGGQSKAKDFRLL